MNWTGGRLSRHSRNAKGGVIGKQREHFAKVRNAQKVPAPKMSPIRWSVPNQIASASRDQPEAEPSEIRGIKRKLGKEDRPRDTILRSELQLKQNHDVETPRTEKVQHGQTILEKRREMLSKVDWVGVAFRNPPDLKYIPPEKSDQIAKRRRVSGGHRARYEPRRREITPVRAAQLPPKDSHEVKLRTADVRISIGGKELRVGVSSSSGIGIAPLDAVKRAAGTASSDIMLLDCEDADTQGPLLRKYDDTMLTSLVGPRRNSLTNANSLGSQGSSSFMLLTEPLEPPHISKDLSSANLTRGRERRSSLSSKDSYIKGSARLQNPSSNHSGRTLTTSQIRELYYNFRDQSDGGIASFKRQEKFVEQGSPNILVQQSEGGLDELAHVSERQSTAASSDRFMLLSFGDSYKATKDSNNRRVEPEVTSRESALKPRRSVSPSRLMAKHPVYLHRSYQDLHISQNMPSDASDTGTSMLVQTGKAESALRQVENLDEEVWRSWVLPEDSPEQTKTWEIPESDQVALSPGISMYDAYSKEMPQSAPVAVEERLENSTEVRQSIEEDVDDASNITENAESALQLHPDLESCLYFDPTKSKANSEEQGEIIENTTRSVLACTLDPCNPKDQLDEDALWQKFVFTSDSEGEESTTDLQADRRKRPSVPHEHSEDSSLLAHPSTESEDPSQKSAAISKASASKDGYRGLSELRKLMTEIPPSDQEPDERVSQRTTQVTPAVSPMVVGCREQEAYDDHTTYATQGSYRSSPDILSTGSPLLGLHSRKLAGSQNNTEQHMPLATKRRIVFATPKPFIGKGSTALASRPVQKPLRIGRKFAAKKRAKGKSGIEDIEGGKERSGKGRDLYDSLASDDEAESIEDY